MSVPETQSMAQIFINKLLKKLDKQLEGKKVEGSSRNGAVKIVISGQFRVLEVKISPRLSCNRYITIYSKQLNCRKSLLDQRRRNRLLSNPI